MIHSHRLTVLAVAIALVASARLPAQDVPPCLSPLPELETEGGWNTYWHDPCNPGGGPIDCCQLRAASQPPLVYADVEYMPLMRDQSHERPFQALGSPTGFVLSTSNFEPEFKPGAKLIAGVSLSDWYRVEAVCIGPYRWDDLAAVRNTAANPLGGTGTLRSPFSNFGDPALIAGLDHNDFASINFRSTLSSGELHLRRRLAMPVWRVVPAETSIIVGARYLRIGEQFQYLTTANVPAPLGAVNQVDVTTENFLVGPQAGLLSQVLLTERSWLDIQIKGAVFQNHASQQTLYTNTDNNGLVTMFPGAADRDRTAFLGDLSLIFNHQFTPTWTVRAGYNAYWLTGLALGAQNFNSDINLLRLGPATLDHSGRVAYHGPSLGVEWSH